MLEEGGAPAAQLARHALAGGLAEQAFRYGVAAGDAAVEVFSVKDAIEHYERARDLLTEVRTGSRQLTEPSVPDLEHLYIQLGRAYELPEEWDKAREAYEAMLALAREVEEARLEVGALNNLAVLAFHQESDPPRARRLLEEARRVAEEAGLEESLVETECTLADVMTYGAGEFEHSGALARKALASARTLEERPDLIARALETLARLELFRGRLEESAAYAEEGAELSRELAERPPPRTLLPSMPTAMGLMASWKMGNKAMEIQCLMYLAYVWVFQGRLQEGIAFGREVLGKSRELPERAEAMGSPALSLGLLASGEYEEALEVCRRGTELARKAQDMFLLWHNLDHLGRAYEALLDLKAARRVYEETLELGAQLGPQYEALSSASLCAVAALSENWEEAYSHARRAYVAGTSFDVLDGLYIHHEVEALLRGGDERRAREVVRRFADRPRTNGRERIAYLRSMAVLSEWEGETQETLDHLREAEALAEKIGLPKELWQIQSKIGYLYEQRGQAEEAREVFSLAAQTLRMLAGNIGDEKLMEGFLSAPRVLRVLRHD